MATVAASRTDHVSFGRRLWHASFAGPEAGALLIVTLVFVTHANFRTSESEQAALDWQIALRLATCAVCGAYGLCHLGDVSRALFRFPGAWCTLYLAWASLTVPLAMNPRYALAAAVTMWCTMFFVAAVLSQLGGRRIAQVLLVAITIYVVLSWGVYIFLPSVGRTAFVYDEVVYRLGGLGHPNDTGMMAALGSALVFVLRVAGAIRWRIALPLLAMFLMTLIYAESRTAMAVAVSALAICLVRTRPALTALAAVGLLAAALAVVVVANDDKGPLATLTRSGETDELLDFTGRTYVWQFVAGKIRYAPLLGYGYNCSRFVMIEYNFGREEYHAVNHPHNLLLNVVLGTGLPGGVLFLGMAGSLLVAFFRRPSILPDVVLAVVLIGGLTEVVIFYPIPGTCTVLWLIALYWRQMGMSLDPEPRADSFAGPAFE